MFILRFVAFAAAFLVVPGAAQAQDKAPCPAGFVCASDPETVMRAMEKAGLKPQLTTDNQGDPMIESDEAPYHFDVYFYGCEETKNCDSLRFEVEFKKEDDNTADLANRWNRSRRFLQASVREDGRFLVGYDLTTVGGLSEANFASVLEWWGTMLGDLVAFFKEELGPEPVPAPTSEAKPKV